jgi:GAF domain-containing protein
MRTEVVALTRESLLAETFVALADTLVDEFDVVEFLSLLSERCVELFEAEAAGVMLAGAGGTLTLVASSSERMRMIELFELQGNEGPCPDCYRTGDAVAEADLATTERWPTFTAEALRVGFRAVSAVPMHLRGQVIGALNLFRNGSGPIPAGDLRSAQALADVATLGILQHRLNSEAHLVTEQLESALNSRIVIEQAKGMLAERAAVDVDEAFSLLRRYARNHNRHLSGVAREVLDGILATKQLTQAISSSARRSSA